MIKSFVGYIDIRDLKKIKRKGKHGFFHPQRHLTLYDKHWYDNKCALVKVSILNTKELD